MKPNGNGGLDAARKAALAVGGSVALAPDAGTDWNDQHAERGDATAKERYTQSVASPIASLIEAVRNHDIAPIARFDDWHWQQVRKQVAEEAGTDVRFLDRERAKALQTAERSAPKSLIVYPEADPWRGKPSLRRLLNDIADTVQSYVRMSDAAIDAVTLFAAFTHIAQHASIAPLLLITSPEKRSGKTRLASVLHRLVSRPIFTSNISPAALFRLIEREKPTLIVDEADTFIRENPELRGVLNAGHSRDSAYVIRCEGEDFEPRSFFVFGPKIVAGIGDRMLADTTRDRSIRIPLQRKLVREAVERIPQDVNAEPFVTLRRKLVRWAEDCGTKVMRIEIGRVPGLHDRAYDNWEPLFQIAQRAGRDWPDRAQAAALALTGQDDVDSLGTLLLRDLADLVKESTVEAIASKAVVAHLHELDSRPWPEYRDGEPITEVQLARLLKPFGVHSRQKWLHGKNGEKGKNVKAYDLKPLRKVMRRYCPDALGEHRQVKSVKYAGPSLKLTERRR